MLPLCCNSSPTSASPSSLHNSAFSAHQSICCQSALSGWSYLFAVGTFWALVSVCLRQSYSDSPTTDHFHSHCEACHVPQLSFTLNDLDLCFSYVSFWLPFNAIHCTTCHRVLKGCWPLWLPCWDYFDLSYFCSYWLWNKMRPWTLKCNLAAKMQSPSGNEWPLHLFIFSQLQSAVKEGAQCSLLAHSHVCASPCAGLLMTTWPRQASPPEERIVL